MPQLFQGATLIAATITVGLIAGLFAAFSYCVMPGLHRTDDRTVVEAMQKINVAIINPWFAFCFFGAMVFTALAAVLHLSTEGRAALPWIIAALILYGATLAITLGLNVPLNDQLAAAGDPGRIADLAAVRKRFEAPWVRWNLARTLTSTAALGCLAWALVQHGRGVS